MAGSAPPGTWTTHALIPAGTLGFGVTVIVGLGPAVNGAGMTETTGLADETPDGPDAPTGRLDVGSAVGITVAIALGRTSADGVIGAAVKRSGGTELASASVGGALIATEGDVASDGCVAVG